MAGKSGIIQFRVGQNAKTVANDKAVQIFAPHWVEKALEKLSEKLKGSTFAIGNRNGAKYKIADKLTLIDLVAIARNESANTTGIIQYDQYNGIDKKIIIALRDLVKHCVIVGKDVATHFGGYPAGQPKSKLNKEVYVCDLPGLQFQQLDNTGRHVLIAVNNDFPQGDLDQEIYLNTVGENKPTYSDARKNKTNRFIKGTFKDKEVYFDTQAYYAFIAQDFILAAKALHIQAKNEEKELNFKFLKYGAGFFAEDLEGEAKNQLSEHLTKGVLLGLYQWLKLPLAQRNKIKRIELPFYKEVDNVVIENTLNEIASICAQHDIEFSATNQDALAQTSKKYITATTNCSDPHAPTGNEMHYGSVDAAIAENLARKGNNFSPICNKEMQCQFLTIPVNKYQEIKKRQTQEILKDFFTLLAISACLVGAHYGLGLGLALGLIVKVTLVFAGVGLLRTGRELFKSFKRDQYQTYVEKSSDEIKQLSGTQQAAFDIGVNATKSYGSRVYSFVAWQAYRSPKAYYAGLEAQQENNEKLIRKVHCARNK
ncbi:hypothetical protein [Candidatus Berkiella aquae]|uniref:Uncharacterized protein n=1 Tax=Candidatus Berkiella aquae TaxID=295108 RepID=A0A0Q9Z0E3_9GAMM|nr:hypothetical protein [Candidatus Berkiella aquae]MCS5710335.1 hypothetical protein [Candidatus Berkiella aquae]